MNIIGILVALLLVVSTTMLGIQVMNMNIIPDKYMIYIYIMIVVLILFCILLAVPKVNWIIKIILSLISIVIIIGSGYGIIKIKKFRL